MPSLVGMAGQEHYGAKIGSRIGVGRPECIDRARSSTVAGSHHARSEQADALLSAGYPTTKSVRRPTPIGVVTIAASAP
jgi:hypothetical protein